MRAAGCERQTLTLTARLAEAATRVRDEIDRALPGRRARPQRAGVPGRLHVSARFALALLLVHETGHQERTMRDALASRRPAVAAAK